MLALVRSWPTSPAACQVEPLVSCLRSSSTTSRQPSRARWYATEQPMMPPPTITARACAGTSLISTSLRAAVQSAAAAAILSVAQSGSHARGATAARNRSRLSPPEGGRYERRTPACRIDGCPGAYRRPSSIGSRSTRVHGATLSVLAQGGLLDRLQVAWRHAAFDRRDHRRAARSRAACCGSLIRPAALHRPLRSDVGFPPCRPGSRSRP